MAATFFGMANKPRAAGYIRLSVLTEDTYSPETQRAAILKKCKDSNWTIKEKEAILDGENLTKIGGGDFYVDLGYSGSKGIHRPAYKTLLNELSNYDYVVVYKLDRFTRRVSELGTVLELLEKSKTALVSISDGIDTSTIMGQSLAELLGAIAAAEARNTRDRVMSGQQTMLKQGKWRGGPPPYGYDIKKGNPGEGSTLVINKEQAKFIRLAVKLFISGKSIPSICKTLNSKGSRSVFGNPWSDPTLRRLLGSPYLVGYQVYNGEIFRNEQGLEVKPFPELIDLDTYNILQAKIKERHFYHPSRGGALLSGFIYCVYCGGRMIGASPTEHGGATYRCRNKYQLHKDCYGLSTKSKALENYVSQVIIQLLSEPKNRDKILSMTKTIRKYANKPSKDNPEAKHEFLRGELQSLQERKLSGQFNYRGGEETFQNAWDVLRVRIGEVEKELEDFATKAANPDLDNLLNQKSLKSIQKLWEEDLSISQRREVAKALIRKIVILPNTADYRTLKTYDTDRVVIEWQWGENKSVIDYFDRNKVPQVGRLKSVSNPKKTAKAKPKTMAKKKGSSK